MQSFLTILAITAGGMSLLMVIGALSGGSDLQLIGAGVFLTVLALSVGCAGIMTRLEEIRDRARKE